MARLLEVVARLLGGIVFAAGVVGLLASTYLAIALRSYADNLNQDYLVWPFFGIFIAISILFCEAGRSSLKAISPKLLLVELLTLSACIVWYLVF